MGRSIGQKQSIVRNPLWIDLIYIDSQFVETHHVYVSLSLSASVAVPVNETVRGAAPYMYTTTHSMY